ncbi:hypothetical protein D3C80_1712500 [compost metagenome]
MELFMLEIKDLFCSTILLKLSANSFNSLWYLPSADTVKSPEDSCLKRRVNRITGLTMERDTRIPVAIAMAIAIRVMILISTNISRAGLLIS